MKKKLILRFLFLTTLWCLSAVPLRAQLGSFTYQGSLKTGSSPANGAYDFRVTFYDVGTGGSPLGGTEVSSVQVTGGIFTLALPAPLDIFGNGDIRFIEIAVRAAGSGGAYETLTPRQIITSAPYAVRSLRTNFAEVADNASTAQFANQAQTATTATNVTGVVAVANGGTGSATKNFVDLSTYQSNIGGDKNFTGAVSVSGASGVFNGNGSGLTNLNGANLTNGSVTSAQLSADAQPNNSLRLLGSLRWDLLKGQRDVAVGSAPQGIAFDGANMWVVNVNGNSVTKLRASDGAVLGTFPAGGGPQYIAFDGANLWITNFASSNNVRKMRASDGVILGTFSVPDLASAIAFDGRNLWVQNGNNVTKLRASDGAIQGTFAVGTFPLRIAFDGAHIWVTNFSSGNVTKLRASDGANLGAFPVSAATGIVFDGSSIWVVNSAAGSLVKLRASDGANLGTFPIAGGASDVAFDGTNLWVANGNSPGTITRVKASDGSSLGTFSVGNAPKAFAFDGTNMWVTNQNSNTVTILPPAFP